MNFLSICKKMTSMQRACVSYNAHIVNCNYGRRFYSHSNSKEDGLDLKMEEQWELYKESSSLVNRINFTLVNQKIDQLIREGNMSKLGKIAIPLITGIRKYPDFSSEEKKIVDAYQDIMSSAMGGSVLPNTAEDILDQEYRKYLEETSSPEKE